MVAEQDAHGGGALLLGELDDGLDGGQRAACAAEGAVGDDVDALLLAVLCDLGLGQPGVDFELDGGGDDLGLGEKLIEILFAVL